MVKKRRAVGGMFDKVMMSRRGPAFESETVGRSQDNMSELKSVTGK